ncbi:MAG TPA: cob(I)yrinic acid a,c-diamide adenosyltransferase [Acidimicrobiales bacterium]|nr:cob(I)yrinic acid a,c-diamide adenosyltransferase [Acidimicrobiales bacterium]
MRIYTRTGDDGTTGLLFGGRVRKDSAVTEACGTVDEAQAALGLVRAEAPAGEQLHELVLRLERELWVLMAEVATAPENRHKLRPEQTLVTEAMVEGLEALIDELGGRFEVPTGFVVPGQTVAAARLDLARAVVRRAERRCLAVAAEGSRVPPYLNRLSDLLWTMARWQEGESLPARTEG